MTLTGQVVELPRTERERLGRGRESERECGGWGTTVTVGCQWQCLWDN